MAPREGACAYLVYVILDQEFTTSDVQETLTHPDERQLSRGINATEVPTALRSMVDSLVWEATRTEEGCVLSLLVLGSFHLTALPAQTHRSMYGISAKEWYALKYRGKHLLIRNRRAWHACAPERARPTSWHSSRGIAYSAKYGRSARRTVPCTLGCASGRFAIAKNLCW